MWLCILPVSQTKVEVRELLNTCNNNIFHADLSNDIVWALVKLMDNANKWDGRTVGKKKGEWGAQVHCLWKGWGFGWNDKGAEL